MIFQTLKSNQVNVQLKELREALRIKPKFLNNNSHVLKIWSLLTFATTLNISHLALWSHELLSHPMAESSISCLQDFAQAIFFCQKHRFTILHWANSYLLFRPQLRGLGSLFLIIQKPFCISPPLCSHLKLPLTEHLSCYY